MTSLPFSKLFQDCPLTLFLLYESCLLSYSQFKGMFASQSCVLSLPLRNLELGQS